MLTDGSFCVPAAAAAAACRGDSGMKRPVRSGKGRKVHVFDWESLLWSDHRRDTIQFYVGAVGRCRAVVDGSDILKKRLSLHFARH